MKCERMMNALLLIALWVIAILPMSCGKKPTDGEATKPQADRAGQTPASDTRAVTPTLKLHEAAAAGDLPTIEALIKQGMDVNLADESQQTPLHVAAWHGQDRIVQWLLDHKADPVRRDALGQTAMDLALSAGHTQVALLLAAKMTGPEALSLHRAAAAGDTTLLKWLATKGQDVNAKDDVGRTALHVAASHGQVQIVEALLAAKADVNAKDAAGCTPLHAAVVADNADCVSALLQAGANPNIEDASGRTPLHRAAALAGAAVVELLLKKGAADKPGPEGTAAQVALDWGNLDAYDLLAR